MKTDKNTTELKTDHELKILPKYMKSVVSGKKTFEIRFNDRNYKIRDTVRLREFNGEYTGVEFVGIIDYITDYEQQKGFVVFSLSEYNPEPTQRSEGARH